MLGMLDAKPAISRAIDLVGILVIVENRRVCTVADGMDMNLQLCPIGSRDRILHRRQNIGTRQPGRCWSIGVRLEEPRRGRTQAAVGISLKTPDPQEFRTERIMQS